MREMLFRAWFKTKPSWCNQMFYSREEGTLGNWFSEIQIEQDDVEVLEYTGLKDKNGVEIYEGDVMRWHNSLVPRGADPTALSTVRWSNRYAMFDGIRRTGEVIGNIYKNPELVKDNV